MYHCPKCKVEMIWSSDNEYEEDKYYTLYICPKCQLEIIDYWGEEE